MPAGVSLRWAVMGSEGSEDAGSARSAPRERPLSPVAEAKQWRSSVPSPLGQWETETKISPYCKSQLESVYAAPNRCTKRASDAGPEDVPRTPPARHRPRGPPAEMPPKVEPEPSR